MASGKQLMTWLAENVKKDQNGEVWFRDLFDGGTLASRRKIGITVRKVFPGVTVHKKRVSGRLEVLYRGISKVDKENIVPAAAECPLDELPKYLPYDIMVQLSDNTLILNIDSLVSVNDNMVVKTVKLSQSKWELWVRGYQVDLSSLQLDCSFTPSKEHALRIIDTVRKMTLCKGFPYIESVLGGRKHYTKEKYKSGSEGESYVARSKSCKQINIWTSQTGVCITCLNLYSILKHSEEIHKYQKISCGQFRKDYLCLQQVKKGDALRKQIKMKPTSKSHETPPISTKSASPVSQKTKGKGKSKAKKRMVVKWPCGGCGTECVADSVCCDTCNIWYHYQCVGLYGDEEELNEDLWFCSKCQT